ncbi:MAG TPA: helix-hairpin-helix domain-containing protein [Flavilitoribacter sp.]|nr:helix-hairpin-helix domain-containing protein [Flavilitoribacter sp.]HMQ90790.1 helix-hairpin-helix domain-containing protein [Flavilitoribacter sp.]
MSWDEFFASWETRESYAVIVFMIIAFLLGLLVGSLLRGPRIRRLKRELQDSNQKLEAVRLEMGGMKDQLDEKEAQVERARFEAEEAGAKAEALELDKARLYKEVYNVNQEIEKLQTANKSYLANIEQLNDQVLGLQTRNEQLAQSEQPLQIAPEPLADEGPEPVEQPEPVPQPEPEVLLTDGADIRVAAPAIVETSGGTDTESRMATFEARLDALARENTSLRSELDALKQQERGFDVPAGNALAFELDPDMEPKVDVSSEKDVLRDKIILSDQPHDDLTRIDGIGPFVARQLNDAGITTFEQIAHWSEEQIEAVTRQIGYFPGRIAKDNWVGQAARLANEPNEIPTAQDDLKIIEGIGPKITQLLNNAGIHTWQELAAAEISQLKAILDAAGEHYRIHDPGTWPAQARLAAEGRWEELKQYQDELKGGREVD